MLLKVWLISSPKLRHRVCDNIGPLLREQEMASTRGRMEVPTREKVLEKTVHAACQRARAVSGKGTPTWFGHVHTS